MVDTKNFIVITTLFSFLAAKRPEKIIKNPSDIKKFIEKLQFWLKILIFFPLAYVTCKRLFRPTPLPRLKPLGRALPLDFKS